MVGRELWQQPPRDLLSSRDVLRVVAVSPSQPWSIPQIYPSCMMGWRITVGVCSVIWNISTHIVMASSHYLNQCWLAINKIFWHSFQGNVYWNTHKINPQPVFEIYIYEITGISPRAQWVKQEVPQWGSTYASLENNEGDFANENILISILQQVHSLKSPTSEAFAQINFGIF